TTTRDSWSGTGRPSLPSERVVPGSLISGAHLRDRGRRVGAVGRAGAELAGQIAAPAEDLAAGDRACVIEPDRDGGDPIHHAGGAEPRLRGIDADLPLVAGAPAPERAALLQGAGAVAAGADLDDRRRRRELHGNRQPLVVAVGAGRAGVVADRVRGVLAPAEGGLGGDGAAEIVAGRDRGHLFQWHVVALVQ